MIERINTLKHDFKTEVQDFLGFWEKYVIHSGDDVFYGVVDTELVPHPDASKHLVLGARLVWTFSSAYRIFKKDLYKCLSKRLYDFLSPISSMKNMGSFLGIKCRRYSIGYQ